MCEISIKPSKKQPRLAQPKHWLQVLSIGVESSLGWEQSNLPSMGRERDLERKEISSSYILVLAKRSSWSLVTIHYRKFSPLFFQYKEKLLQFKQFAPGRRLQWNTPNRLIQSSPELICISHIMIMNFSFGLVFPQDPTMNVGVKSVWKSVKNFC